MCLSKKSLRVLMLRAPWTASTQGAAQTCQKQVTGQPAQLTFGERWTGSAEQTTRVERTWNWMSCAHA